ncbi:MAG TPA: Gfo/Idh/MocA family oxidoreductase [Kofleriaceae bacterium]
MSKKVRYAFVGLGDIAQAAMLPGVAHTGNSEVTALVTGDAKKAEEIGKQYGVSAAYPYAQFDALLRSGAIDAIYLATPNWRHAEFILPALAAGVHVLTEKPLEVSTALCRQIVDAQRASRAKLMVAYRLHFEPATLDLIARVRAGELGDVHLFTATFSQLVDPQNHRVLYGDLAGPVLDMGPYPVNAARYIFGDEPIEVVSATAGRRGFRELDDTVAATLRFPGDRIAQFVVSYFGAPCNAYTVVGTRGIAVMDPGFTYGKPLELHVSHDGEAAHERHRNVDQFGGELRYFSECILEGRDPEPDAEEGFADMRVLEGVLAAVKTGAPVLLPPFQRVRRIDPAGQLQELRPRKPKPLVHAASPTR